MQLLLSGDDFIEDHHSSNNTQHYLFLVFYATHILAFYLYVRSSRYFKSLDVVALKESAVYSRVALLF